jgi:hypothetical protein
LTLPAATLAALLAFGTACADEPAPLLEHVPGWQSYQQGIRDYNEGRLFSARHYFLVAARYGDKVAQYNLGVMYFNGEGVPADRVRGWAWFDLAAERGYPQMVETALDAWDLLDATQRERATAYRDELGAELGDAVVVPRVAAMMERVRRNATGSRTGFVSGTLQIYDRNGNRRSGDEFYAAERWDYQEIVRIETEVFEQLARGRVTMGEFEVTDDDPEDPEDRDN